MIGAGEYRSYNFKKAVFSSLLFILLIQAARFILIMYVKDSADVRVYFDWILFAAYTVVTFAFFPLFVLIMTLFKVTAP